MNLPIVAQGQSAEDNEDKLMGNVTAASGVDGLG
jgi:hypothetical protein